MSDLQEYLKVFVALVAIVNPVGAVPLFLSLTDGYEISDQKKTVFTASVALFVIMVISFFIGDNILKFFGIEVASFRIAGGLLIMMMALTMLHGKRSDAKTNEKEKGFARERESIAVVPLAIPLLGGPGAISTLILYSNEYKSVQEVLLIVSVIFFVCFLTWLSLIAGPYISKFLGRSGINVLTRIMGLLLASLAVEFIVKGALEVFQGFGKIKGFSKGFLVLLRKPV